MHLIYKKKDEQEELIRFIKINDEYFISGSVKHSNLILSLIETDVKIVSVNQSNKIKIERRKDIEEGKEENNDEIPFPITRYIEINQENEIINSSNQTYAWYFEYEYKDKKDLNFLYTRQKHKVSRFRIDSKKNSYSNGIIMELERNFQNFIARHENKYV